MDPLLKKQGTARYTTFPIVHNDLWAMYKKHRAAFWVEDEIDFSADLEDWTTRLTDDERYFIEHILAFFAGSDGIVLENIVDNFSSDVTAPEARAFYSFQGMMETVHSITYSQLIDTLVRDEKRKTELFQAIDTIPCVKEKADWAIKWMSPKRPFAERLVAFAIVEGLFFAGAFCSVFWLKERGLMTKALGVSNELIARDEGLHCVVPSTLIYVREGHSEGYVPIIDCADKLVELWNGSKWIETVPVRTGRNVNTMSVTLSNGLYLKCTPEHYWNITGKRRVRTRDLQIGMVVADYTMPKGSSDVTVGSYKNYDDAMLSVLEAMTCGYNGQIDIRSPENGSVVFDTVLGPKGDNTVRGLVITGIEDNVELSDVYCFTDFDDHNGLFNGISTGQCDFACLLYSKLQDSVDQKRVLEIMQEAVIIEKKFICDSLPCDLIGMNKELMSRYIEFVADRLLVQLGAPRHWNATNPFDFMTKISMPSNTNFFEQRVTNYQMSNSVIKQEDKRGAFDDMDDDF